MKLRAKSRTYAAAGPVNAGEVFEADDKSGEAMIAAGIASKASDKAEPAHAEPAPPVAAKKGK